MPAKSSTVLLAVGLVVGVQLGWWLCRWHDIDRCLDRGGRWRRAAYSASTESGGTTMVQRGPLARARRESSVMSSAFRVSATATYQAS